MTQDSYFPDVRGLHKITHFKEAVTPSVTLPSFSPKPKAEHHVRPILLERESSSTPKLLVLLAVWYVSSAFSNNSTKSILRIFPHPSALTEVQFSLSAICCIISILVAQIFPKLIEKFPIGTFHHDLGTSSFSLKTHFLMPTKKIVRSSLPMGGFQFVGHITSHKATSLIPVFLVHTIKALSPITTVIIYRFLFQVRYPRRVYFSLIPVVSGVMLSCMKGGSIDSPNFNKGCLFGLASMIIFVSQNIFAKKILTNEVPKKSQQVLPTINSVEAHVKVDKITLLFHCSVVGFILTLPLFLTSNGITSILSIDMSLFGLMMANGTFHFIQSIVAFQILGCINPINYSIANISKRIVVIGSSILLERSRLTIHQGSGLILTMAGLYLYNRWGYNKCVAN